MKLPISKRLLACADLVPPCHTATDVGTDHGYLAIRLLQTDRCARVIAADLREQPLASARANAAVRPFSASPGAKPAVRATSPPHGGIGSLSCRHSSKPS